MRKLLFFVVYLIFFGIQVTVPQPAWLKFDLVLLFVYAMAMLYGPQTGGRPTPLPGFAHLPQHNGGEQHAAVAKLRAFLARCIQLLPFC